MSREFNGSTQFLSNDGIAPDTSISHPVILHFSAWANIDALPVATHTVISVSDISNDDYFFRLSMRDGAVSGYKAEMRIKGANGGQQAIAESTNDLSANTWHHIFGMCISNTSANWTNHIWLDNAGTASHTDGINSAFMGNQDTTTIGGIQYNTGLSNPFPGSIAEAAIWIEGSSTQFTAGERASLAAGVSPIFIKPWLLAAYWPLIGDEDFDLTGQIPLTPTASPTVDTHPPQVIKPQYMQPTIEGVSGPVIRIPRYGFTNFQVPGVV